MAGFARKWLILARKWMQIKEFKYALAWGQSTKHAPQRVGKDHILMDEDIVQVAGLSPHW